jgi:hypothetical protein
MNITFCITELRGDFNLRQNDDFKSIFDFLETFGSRDSFFSNAHIKLYRLLFLLVTCKTESYA